MNAAERKSGSKRGQGSATQEFASRHRISLSGHEQPLIGAVAASQKFTFRPSCMSRAS
jgi:hypothetical protein